MTATPRAEPVVRAAWAIIVGAGIDGSGTRERIPAEAARGRRHLVVPVGPSQRRHRIFTPTRRFENISAPIDFSFDVPCFARDAELAFGDVVIPFELLDTERPVFHGRTGRNPRSSVPFPCIADHLEIPCAEAPALRPVVERCTTNTI